jgi:hypothetical protein
MNKTDPQIFCLNPVRLDDPPNDASDHGIRQPQKWGDSTCAIVEACVNMHNNVCVKYV